MGTAIWPIEGVVLGASGPAVAGSLGDNIQALYNANYTPGRVYPTLAVGATLLSGADWVLGDFGTIVPANGITAAFHISAICVETCDVANGVLELAVYSGDPDVLMATVRFSITGGFYGNSVYLIPSVKHAANTRIRGKLASSDGTANPATITVSIMYRLLGP